jgi:hypothetical protein
MHQQAMVVRVASACTTFTIASTQATNNAYVFVFRIFGEFPTLQRQGMASGKPRPSPEPHSSNPEYSSLVFM